MAMPVLGRVAEEVVQRRGVIAALPVGRVRADERLRAAGDPGLGRSATRGRVPGPARLPAGQADALFVFDPIAVPRTTKTSPPVTAGLFPGLVVASACMTSLRMPSAPCSTALHRGLVPCFGADAETSLAKKWKPWSGKRRSVRGGADADGPCDTTGLAGPGEPQKRGIAEGRTYRHEPDR